MEVAARIGTFTQAEEKPGEPELPFLPQPERPEDTGIDFGQLVELAIKTIYYLGRPTARSIGEKMALPFSVIDAILQFLKREQLIEVVGSGGLSEQQYQYSLTNKGTEKANECLDRNKYVGPAPVTFESYVEMTLRQSVHNIRVDVAGCDSALSGLVLSRTTRSLIGPAVNSGRSMLLYGEPGNGKSSITKAIGDMLPGNVLIPHAIDIAGQTVRVFDPRVHREVRTEEEPPPGIMTLRAGTEPRRDLRWAIAKRPLIMAGGELTLADLELRFSPLSKFYIAPLQLKANCGVLVIDDFGRQLLQPKELLNRWIVPMEARVDHLTLVSGETVEIPFELLLVFSTNIPPQQIGDEAFFRRIRHKIEIPDPTREQFLEILTRVCQQREITLETDAALYLVDHYYERGGRAFKGCHPRDIIDLVVDICAYHGEQPAFTLRHLDAACQSYFVSMQDAPAAAPADNIIHLGDVAA